VLIADVNASSNRACATCPIVATGESRPLLLGHHSTDGIVVVGHLPVATEGYGPLLQRHIVVVWIAWSDYLTSWMECLVLYINFVSWTHTHNLKLAYAHLTWRLHIAGKSRTRTRDGVN
jgi:hypothetical protein